MSVSLTASNVQGITSPRICASVGGGLRSPGLVMVNPNSWKLSGIPPAPSDGFACEPLIGSVGTPLVPGPEGGLAFFPGRPGGMIPAASNCFCNRASDLASPSRNSRAVASASGPKPAPSLLPEPADDPSTSLFQLLTSLLYSVRRFLSSSAEYDVPRACDCKYSSTAVPPRARCFASSLACSLC
jgi:hypothetical protein